jgi:type IV secretion system protein VirB8
MTEETNNKREDYYAQAGSWTEERTQAIYASRKVAWIVALIAAIIAVLEALALVTLVPLKTVVPHTILVDRQTGFVQALDPANPQNIAPDKALTQAFLVQYVQAREGFDIATVQQQFKKVSIWTSGRAKSRYVNLMQASNPESPLATLPRTSVIDVKIRSVSQLSPGTALVRFASTRIDQGASEQPVESWVAVIRYRYSKAPMTVEDRYINPLGFEVTSYRKDAEALPSEPATATATAAAQPPAKIEQIGDQTAKQSTENTAAAKVQP